MAKTKRPGKAVQAPVFINRSSKQTGANSIRYRECERVATIVGSVAFSVGQNLPMNPALSSSFPWLSGHAQLYERYKVHKLIYRYKNLKGTSSAGNILMSFDYDTLDAAPATAVALTQSTVWIDGAPWRIFEMRVPTDGRSFFTRSGSIVGDLKTYDFGRLFVATEGCADTTDHGYLEVEYDIELFEKQSSSSSAAPSNQAVAQYNLGSNQAASGTTVTIAFDEEIANPFGITNSSGTLTVPVAGNFLISASASFSGAGATRLEIEVNDTSLTQVLKTDAVSNIAFPPLYVEGFVALAAGDTVRARLTGNTSCTIVADTARLILQAV